MKSYMLIPILSLLLPCCHNRNEGSTFDVFLHNDNHIKSKFSNDKFEEGLVYAEDRQYGSAKKCFLLADSACPDMPVILNALGNSATRIPNDSLLAFQSYEKALSIDSDFINTYSNYGCFLNNLMEYDSAIIIFEAGLRRKKIHKFDRSLLFLNLATSFYMLGQNEKALALLNRAKQGLSQGEIYDKISLFQNEVRRSGPARP